MSYFGPRTAEDWAEVINLWLLDGYTPLETVQILIGDYPEWEQEIRDGLELVPGLQIDNAEWEEERQNHWRQQIGLSPLPPVDYSTGDPLADRPSFYRPVLRRPGGRAAHRRESRSSGDDDDHEDAVRAFLDAIDRWERGL